MTNHDLLSPTLDLKNFTNEHNANKITSMNAEKLNWSYSYNKLEFNFKIRLNGLQQIKVFPTKRIMY